MSPTQSTCRLFILCFSAFLIGKVVAKPDGAPVAACFDMTPQHFDPPQETDCPFVIKPAKEDMWSNGTLEVSLEVKNSDDKFKGFLMMAFDQVSSSTTPIGTFSEPKGKLGKVIDCRKDGSKNAVTHNNRTPKTAVVATWTPPEDFEGVVVFNTTFVQSLDTYWVKQSSTTVKVKRAVASTISVSSNESTTKKPSSNTVSPSDSSTTESSTTWTSTVPPEIPGSASPISLLAFYSVIIIGITIAFMA